MCGMKVVVVASDESGNIDLEDLRAKALKHKDNLVRQRDRHNDEVSLLSCSSFLFPSTLPHMASTYVTLGTHTDFDFFVGCVDGNVPQYLRSVRGGDQDYH